MTYHLKTEFPHFVICRLILRKFFTSRTKHACRAFLEKQKGLLKRNKCQRNAIHLESRAISVTGKKLCVCTADDAKLSLKEGLNSRVPVTGKKLCARAADSNAKLSVKEGSNFQGEVVKTCLSVKAGREVVSIPLAPLREVNRDQKECQSSSTGHSVCETSVVQFDFGERENVRPVRQKSPVNFGSFVVKLV